MNRNQPREYFVLFNRVRGRLEGYGRVVFKPAVVPPTAIEFIIKARNAKAAIKHGRAEYLAHKTRQLAGSFAHKVDGRKQISVSLNHVAVSRPGRLHRLYQPTAASMGRVQRFIGHMVADGRMLVMPYDFNEVGYIAYFTK